MPQRFDQLFSRIERLNRFEKSKNLNKRQKKTIKRGNLLKAEIYISCKIYIFTHITMRGLTPGWTKEVEKTEKIIDLILKFRYRFKITGIFVSSDVEMNNFATCQYFLFSHAKFSHGTCMTEFVHGGHTLIERSASNLIRLNYYFWYGQLIYYYYPFSLNHSVVSKYF